ncbi:hypothetical protein SpCBS45565_g05312 [Spizellomyces sp. 'palustris']|nr:hypothetical protein SpCBS45565_g05312 [Spizellomyces sp. 'palustris']
MDALDKIHQNLLQGLSLADQTDFKGHCEKCDKPVLNDTGPGLSYTQDGIQHAYHRKCFTCAECQKPIDDTSFYLHLEKPHCKACYEERILGRCAACDESLSGTATMKAGSKKFHPKCFVCEKCKTELQGRYFEKDDAFWCRSCYEVNYLPDCDACGKKIQPDDTTSKITMVQCKDKKYHQGCFACKDCRKPFDELKALHHKDELYCQDCYFAVIKAMEQAAA